MGKQTKLNGAQKKKGSPKGSDKMNKTHDFPNNNNGNDLRNRKRQKDPPHSKHLFRRPGRPRIGVDATDDCSHHIFPRKAEVIVFLVTLGVRLYYVSRKRNWWILHPDEVFQITEVAHSEVYGYGFRAYEYQPPPPGHFSSQSAKDMASLGMYALRSFILPKIFMFVFTLAEMAGIKDQPFLVSKLFHAAVASCLPLSVYRLTKTLYSSRDLAVMAAIMAAASHHLTMFGTHVLVNSFLSPVVIWCVAEVLDAIAKQSPSPNGSAERIDNNNISPNNTTPDSSICSHLSQDNTDLGNWRILLVGFILGLCAYIRVDLTLFLVLFFMPFTLLHMRCSLQFFFLLAKFAASFFAGMATAGVDDLLSYGKWGLSVYQWVKFNVATGHTATFFGQSGGTRYLYDILLVDWLSTLLFATTVAVIALQLGRSYSRSPRFSTSLSLLLVATMMFLVYSSQPHKETRFLHNAVVILCIIQSWTVWNVVQWTKQALHFSVKSTSVSVLGVTFFYIYSSWATFPNSADDSHLRWAFQRQPGSHDVNKCLSYVSQQNDVTGVFNGFSMQATGGYSLLHKDVTFLTLVRQEFCEYSVEARTPYNISISSVNNVSDYISSENVPSVYKILVENRIYNYAVVPRESDFSKLGYLEVFTSGIAKVVKRSLSPSLVAAAKQFLEGLPTWTNAAVLEEESSRLLSFGLPSKAIPRLQRALSLNRDRIRTYKLLMRAFEKTGNVEGSLHLRQDCFSRHGQEACLAPLKPVDL
ncbi:uncharacterized protein LOC135476921 [Liolophura sinensis]|uniref:uncharacterized protein LOC135476921 n=1 Tax=Liolophura sinensis TaxID=3198878 RepID=UPI0031586F6A